MSKADAQVVYVQLKGKDRRTISFTVYDLSQEQLIKRIVKACSDKPVRLARKSSPVPACA